MVVAFHAGLPVPGGFTGVDVFFVISGFVIMGMLGQELETSSRISLAAFYARRIRRLLPALALMVTVVAVLSLFLLSPLQPKQMTAKTGIAAAMFVANVFLYRNPSGYFDAGPTSNALLNTWSLSLEEQFYLVFPALVLVAWMLGRPSAGRRTGNVRAVLWVATLGSFALCVASTGSAAGAEVTGIGARFAFYMAPARAWEFGAGALLALGATRVSRLPTRAAVVLGSVGALLIALGAVRITESTPFPGYAALIPVVGTCLVLAAGTATAAGVSAGLSLGPMTRLGDLSYSWYLWHWPLIVFALAAWPAVPQVALVAALGSLVPAWWSYRFLENPLRGDTRIVGRRALVVAAICVSVPVLACVVLARTRLPNRSSATQARLDALTERHADELRGCGEGPSLDQLPPACRWPVRQSRGMVLLVGDSNAGHFTEPAARGANEAGYTFEVATKHGCRMADVLAARGGVEDRGCLEYVRRTVEQIERRRPSLVLIGNSSPGLVSSKGVTLQDPRNGAWVGSTNGKARIWGQGLGRVLAELGDEGIPTVVLQTVPQFPDWQPNCAAIRVELRPRSCGTSLSRAQADEYRGPALAAEQRAVDGVTTARAIDFAAAVCEQGRCVTNSGDRWYYRDQSHLSVRFSVSLADTIRGVVEDTATHAGESAVGSATA